MKCFGMTTGAVFFAVLVWGAACANGAETDQFSGSLRMPVYMIADAEPLADDVVMDQPECYAACPTPAPPQPWKMPQLPALQKLGIATGGWVQQGITFNNYGSSNTFNGPMAINDLNEQYQLNQAWLYFVKPTDTGGCGCDIGGRIDVVYGTDWRWAPTPGLENNINGSDNYYGLVLPQFYLEVAINDLKVKLGRFGTFTSYELVPAPLNFFYSHSYLTGGYFDPLLVTGLQAEYKLNDQLTAVGGFNRGWLNFEDPTDTFSFLGGVKWASCDKRENLSLMVDTGPETGFTGVNDRHTVYLVYTCQLNKCLLYASQYDIGQEKNGSVVSPGHNANYYGVEQVLIRKLNDRWSAGLRFEWARDEDGARIAGIGNLIGSDKGWLGQPGFAGSWYDVTLGLNYRPHPNVVFRPEVRWDSYHGTRNVANQAPFDNFRAVNQFTTAMDMIITF